MKILVHNYSSETSTEPLYLTQAAKNKGYRAEIWNNNVSAFDAFDKLDPDLFITHYAALNTGAVKRLKESKATTLINVTGARPESLQMLKEHIKDPLFFSNFKMSDKIPVISPAADIFMGNRENKLPKYAIESLFVVDNQLDVDSFKPMFESQESYHVISTSKDFRSEDVDCSMSVDGLCFIYENYENVFVTKPTQTFYDAAFYRGTCGIVNSSSFLKKEIVETAHSPYNRLEALLEYIGQSTENK